MVKKVWLAIAALILVLAAAGVWAFWQSNYSTTSNIQKAAPQSFEECAEQGYPIQESYPRRCTADGVTFTEDLTLTESANIKVTSPSPNELIFSPVTISGEARTFEQNVVYRITDDSGKVLAFGNTTSTAPDLGIFGPYIVQVSFDTPTTDTGKVEVFEGSAQDGSEINKVTIPVRFR